MGEIININEFINIQKDSRSSSGLRTAVARLDPSLIMSVPTEEAPTEELAAEHTSEPIRSMEDIDRICKYLLSNNRWRDYMLFIVGINFGLRVSDLKELRFSNLINSDLTFKDSFPILEIKTKNTRRVRRNRYITINNAVIEAVTLFLEHTPNVKLTDYMFRSESNRGINSGKPLSSVSIDRILKGINNDLGLGIHMSTHSLRKTFGYHQMMMSNNDPRKLLLLSKMFGHSSTVITMDYIGITTDEMQDAYRNLNLGSAKNYIDSCIGEREILVG